MKIENMVCAGGDWKPGIKCIVWIYHGDNRNHFGYNYYNHCI